MALNGEEDEHPIAALLREIHRDNAATQSEIHQPARGSEDFLGDGVLLDDSHLEAERIVDTHQAATSSELSWLTQNSSALDTSTAFSSDLVLEPDLPNAIGPTNIVEDFMTGDILAEWHSDGITGEALSGEVMGEPLAGQMMEGGFLGGHWNRWMFPDDASSSFWVTSDLRESVFKAVSKAVSHFERYHGGIVGFPPIAAAKLSVEYGLSKQEEANLKRYIPKIQPNTTNAVEASVVLLRNVKVGRLACDPISLVPPSSEMCDAMLGALQANSQEQIESQLRQAEPMLQQLGIWDNNAFGNICPSWNAVASGLPSVSFTVATIRICRCRTEIVKIEKHSCIALDAELLIAGHHYGPESLPCSVGAMVDFFFGLHPCANRTPCRECLAVPHEQRSLVDRLPPFLMVMLLLHRPNEQAQKHSLAQWLGDLDYQYFHVTDGLQSARFVCCKGALIAEDSKRISAMIMQQGANGNFLLMDKASDCWLKYSAADNDKRWTVAGFLLQTVA